MTSAPAQAEAARGALGHPARGAVLITVAVLVALAALVYAVFCLSVRPDAARARQLTTGSGK